MENNNIEKIISLTKRRGFIYQGSEIYGGLAGAWDFGPMGVLLKNNIKNSWWKNFVLDREDMYGMDAAILMNSQTWVNSGHVDNFSDPLVECKKCHKRFREDHLEKKECPECKGGITESMQFNMMFKTQSGAVEDSASLVYLRPETAQGMFVNFKNVVDSMHPKLPFGLAQIGKAFRNEITPKDFIFRVREFEQMEIEYFIKPPDGDDWKEKYDKWLKEIHNWLLKIGLDKNKIEDKEIPDNERSHYSKRTIDIYYQFPHKKDEFIGFAYRTDYDLKAHGLDYYDEELKKNYIPHVLEPSFGVDRVFFAVLCEAYDEDEMNGEKRVVLRFKPQMAPVKVAVFPLLKNKPELVAKAREIFTETRKEIQPVVFDDNGNIGKRYRRQDEIGTPFCVTVDFDTLKDGSVTVRDRDTGKQERVGAKELLPYLKTKLA